MTQARLGKTRACLVCRAGLAGRDMPPARATDATLSVPPRPETQSRVG
jgi:hypothetical protein